MAKINTNIDDYTRDELLDLVDLQHDDTSDVEITQTFDKIIKNYIKKDNYKLAQFFHEAKQKLLYDDFEGEDSEPEPETEAENWLSQQYRTQNNTQQNDKITQRHDKFDIFQAKRTTNPVMSRQTLGVNNTIPLTVAQDGLNPTLRQTVNRLIAIDSQYRPIDIPYTFGPQNSAYSATNFTINLTEPLKNVLSLTLETLYIPSTWYTFDPFYRNTCMWILTSNSSAGLDIDPTTGREYDISSCSKICIAPGNYKKPTDLILEINQDISYCGSPDISGVQAQLVNGLTADPTIQFFNISQQFVKIVFYRQDLANEYTLSANGGDCSGCQRPKYSNCSKPMTYRQNLGYYLGFRITTDDYVTLNNIKQAPSELSTIIRPVAVDCNGGQAQFSTNVQAVYNQYVAIFFGYSHSSFALVPLTTSSAWDTPLGDTTSFFGYMQNIACNMQKLLWLCGMNVSASCPCPCPGCTAPSSCPTAAAAITNGCVYCSPFPFPAPGGPGNSICDIISSSPPAAAAEFESLRVLITDILDATNKAIFQVNLWFIEGLMIAANNNPNQPADFYLVAIQNSLPNLNLIIDSWQQAVLNPNYVPVKNALDKANDALLGLDISTNLSIYTSAINDALHLLCPNSSGEAKGCGPNFMVNVAGVSQAIVPINLLGSQYLSIALEDYTQSRPSSGLIGIAPQNTKLDMPKYASRHSRVFSDAISKNDQINDISASIICDGLSNTFGEGNSIFVPTWPRDLTQNQLYSVNQILANQKNPLPVSRYAPDPHDILAVITLEDNTTASTRINYRQIDNKIFTRPYFGPVTIERLGIKLYDDKGNLVNLNGHDWSFTLRAEQLYQY